MPANTAKYVIPYPLAADTLAAEATAVQNLANRMDLLLGESGALTLSPAAGVTLATPITLGRTYPGNNAGAVPGIVILNMSATAGGAATWNWWVSGWTGSGTTITGFTLSMQWAAAQTNRGFLWRFIPVL